MTLLSTNEARNYLSILSSDGTIRQQVSEGTPQSVRRDYESSSGKKGVKFEKVFHRIEGLITDMRFWESDYGTNLLIDITNGEEKATLSLGTHLTYGEDFMRKFPNVDVKKIVRFEPFSFENETGRIIKGITITQDGKKLQNHYWDFAAKKSVNGMPEPEGDKEKFKNDDWKIFFLKVRKFLIAETEKRMKGLGFPKDWDMAQTPLPPVSEKEEGLDPSAIPF